MPLKLIALPLEILMTIVDYFAPSQARFYMRDHKLDPDRSLYRLAQTCTTFRDICVPKLLESCRIQIWDRAPHGVPRGLSFIRALVARPEVASRVKGIIIDARYKCRRIDDYDSLISTTEAAHFDSILSKALTSPSAIPMFKSVLSSGGIDDTNHGSIDKALVCLALALVPNITSAILLSGFDERRQIPVIPAFGPFKSNYFSSLEAFSIQNPMEDTSTALHNAMGVLHAAPKLRRLFCQSTTWLPLATLPSVKQVVLLYSRLGDEAMAHLPRAFPNLERFTYVDGGYGMNLSPTVAPRVIFEALLGLRKTLSHVELAPGLCHGGPFDKFPMGISQMELLEHLRLPASFIYVRDILKHELNNLHRTTKLVHPLPRSMRNLYLEKVRSSDEPGILALAQAAPHQFPNLSYVTFAPLFEAWKPSNTDIVRRSYEAQGIKCSFEAADMQDYVFQWVHGS